MQQLAVDRFDRNRTTKVVDDDVEERGRFSEIVKVDRETKLLKARKCEPQKRCRSWPRFACVTT